MAIVLQSPLGEVADFFNEFTHYDVNVLELWKDLIHRYGEECIKVAYFLNEIWTENLEDMVKIGLFFADRSKVQGTRREDQKLY